MQHAASPHFLRCFREKPKPSEVFYFVDDEVVDLEYGSDHLMRPVRLKLLHSLVKSLGLDALMTICESRNAEPHDLYPFHPTDFVAFLMNAKLVCEQHLDPCSAMMQYEYGAGAFSDGDCPLFSDVWRVVRSYCGASIACAEALLAAHRNNGVGCKVAINWAGGMHHAAPHKASGFCYANDICLCIMKLLQVYYRVLYIDIDVHHGDGVEHAFAEERRVLTLSIHQFGNGFFPGTGDVEEVGANEGRGFAVNVPVPPRIGDAFYSAAFDLMLHDIMQAFAPEAIVLQCGADSVYGDLIGGICISSRNHARCVEKVLACGLPTVLLGGGGYNVTHTAMTWATDTAAALGVVDELPIHVPPHDAYYGYYRRQGNPIELPRLLIEPPPGRSVGAKGLRALMSRLLPSLEQQLRKVKLWRVTFPRNVSVPANSRAPTAAAVLGSRQFRLETAALAAFADERRKRKRVDFAAKRSGCHALVDLSEQCDASPQASRHVEAKPLAGGSCCCSPSADERRKGRLSASRHRSVATVSESPAGLMSSVGWLHCASVVTHSQAERYAVQSPSSPS